MSVDRELSKRPLRIIREEDIKPDQLERVFVHYDEHIQRLDQRRIAQQDSVTTGSTDSETISNLVTAVNALISALNSSSLTKD